MLKTMEKLVERHIRDEILMLHPLHRYQFVYQLEKSTDTALHYVITHTAAVVGGMRWEGEEGYTCPFLDFEGAFDSTSYSFII